MCLLFVHISSLGKSLFKFFTHFWNLFLLLLIFRILHIFCIFFFTSIFSTSNEYISKYSLKTVIRIIWDLCLEYTFSESTTPPIASITRLRTLDDAFEQASNLSKTSQVLKFENYVLKCETFLRFLSQLIVLNFMV